MCVSCGCGSVEDQHGDSRNITLSGLRAAAKATNLDMNQIAVNNMQQGLLARSGPSEVAANLDAMNQPLPSGQLFRERLVSTLYVE